MNKRVKLKEQLFSKGWPLGLLAIIAQNSLVANVFSFAMTVIVKKVQVNNVQEKAQSDRNSHSKNGGGKIYIDN